MTTVKVSKKTKPKKQYIPHQLRSRPFRCIVLPAICVALFIFYWFILVPVVFHGLTVKCKESCNWPPYWHYIYWAVVSLLFIILLAIAVCLWCFKPDENEEEKMEAQKEHDKLLDQPVKYNNSPNKEKYGLSMVNEKKSVSRETIEDDNFNVANLQTFEGKIEKTTVRLPVRNSYADSVISKENEITSNKEIKDNVEVKEIEDDKVIKRNKEGLKNKNASSMMEEIDDMFPRCSIRRKPESKKRPDTLIIHSPKYPKEDSDLKRHTMSERPRSASPLTPREMFFFDLIQSANRQTLGRTNNFLENERKHSSNNYTSSKKPEVKDFVLKQRSETEPSSPEYFIANVAQRNSCTTEVFLQVDGGQPEETLTICYIDQDDDVFKK